MGGSGSVRILWVGGGMERERGMGIGLGDIFRLGLRLGEYDVGSGELRWGSGMGDSFSGMRLCDVEREHGVGLTILEGWEWGLGLDLGGEWVCPRALVVRDWDLGYSLLEYLVRGIDILVYWGNFPVGRFGGSGVVGLGKYLWYYDSGYVCGGLGDVGSLGVYDRPVEVCWVGGLGGVTDGEYLECVLACERLGYRLVVGGGGYGYGEVLGRSRVVVVSGRGVGSGWGIMDGLGLGCGVISFGGNIPEGLAGIVGEVGGGVGLEELLREWVSGRWVRGGIEGRDWVMEHGLRLVWEGSLAGEVLGRLGELGWGMGGGRSYGVLEHGYWSVWGGDMAGGAVQLRGYGGGDRLGEYWYGLGVLQRSMFYILESARVSRGWVWPYMTLGLGVGGLGLRPVPVNELMLGWDMRRISFERLLAFGGDGAALDWLVRGMGVK